ncbi:MAG: glycogen-binding domain-containing protein [Treponema sp.]|nr:glycogen-binding domain-containing protein [Treponema sp.]
MKKIATLLLTVALCCTAAFADTTVKALPIDEADYAEIASTILDVQAPYVKGDYIIFTQKKGPRYIGIAFDFENFREIHHFQLKHRRNSEYEIEDSIFFYILKLPKTVQTVGYRLVVDGLWTTDPMNECKEFNAKSSLVLSQINARRNISAVTEKLDNGKIRFIYTGLSGQQVRLGASFTNWDSWIYTLQEVRPGQYQIDLPLPPGKYEYAYYIGMKSYPDKTNPERCYTPDGKEASLLVVTR